MKLAGVDISHIPYKGTAPAITDLMANRVDLVLTTGAMPFIRSGKVRAVAVAARQRLPALPEVPTFGEAGLAGLHTGSWYGLVAPAGTPRPVLEKLNTALTTALHDSQLQKQLAEQGALAAEAMDIDGFWDFVKRQMPVAAEQVRISDAGAQ